MGVQNANKELMTERNKLQKENKEKRNCTGKAQDANMQIATERNKPAMQS